MPFVLNFFYLNLHGFFLCTGKKLPTNSMSFAVWSLVDFAGTTLPMEKELFVAF